ncbi:MAG: alpha/beta hydrolase [Proteobacteria bacterium SG_bin9]|nr:MAG: alpha/beta hydrolase [Proteobacteria bacterium SG_bin9]
MPSFKNGSVEIAYIDEGAGDPIVLVHGFASSKNVNWIYPSWTSELTKDGRRVIALDNRGHGESSKLYNTDDYTIGAMASDVLALMDHLNIAKADVMGYSLGARIGAYMAVHHPDRVRSLISGGLGLVLVEGTLPSEAVAQALETDAPETITDPKGKMFRTFADQTRSDRRALAACLRGSRIQMSRAEAASIAVPMLIAVGTTDDVSGLAAPLAEIIPHAEVLDIPNRDHMRAVGDKVYKTGVLDFLSRRP